jgi:hypothetical protein
MLTRIICVLQGLPKQLLEISISPSTTKDRSVKSRRKVAEVRLTAALEGTRYASLSIGSGVELVGHD